MASDLCIHPWIVILLRAVPVSGKTWPMEDQEEWLDLMRGVLRTVYPLPVLEAQEVQDAPA